MLAKEAQFTSIQKQQEIKKRRCSERHIQGERLRDNITKNKQNLQKRARFLLSLSFPVTLPRIAI